MIFHGLTAFGYRQTQGVAAKAAEMQAEEPLDNKRNIANACAVIQARQHASVGRHRRKLWYMAYCQVRYEVSVRTMSGSLQDSLDKIGPS